MAEFALQDKIASVISDIQSLNRVHRVTVSVAK